MNLIKELHIYGALSPLPVDAIVGSIDTLSSFGYDKHITEIEELLSNTVDGEDITSDIIDIIRNWLVQVLLDLGITMVGKSMQYMTEFLRALETVIGLEGIIKEGHNDDIRGLDSNVEILNAVISPYMSSSTEPFEFIVDYIDDSFIFYLQFILKTYDSEDSEKDIIYIHHVIVWLKTKFDFGEKEGMKLESDIDEYFDIKLSKILSVRDKPTTLFEMVYLVLISSDGKDYPLDTANISYGDSEVYPEHMKIATVASLGEYNEQK